MARVTVNGVAYDSWHQAIAGMEGDDFWVITSILVAIAMFGVLWTFRSLKRARFIEDTPTSRIRSAAQGYVELHGSGRSMEGQPIIGPLTERPCTWWSYQIERYERSGKNSHWRTIRKGVSDGFFEIVDDTGHCLIDPDGAEVTASRRDVWKGGSEWPSKGPDEEIGFFSSKRYRYTEERMHDGDPLYALGYFHTSGGGHEFDRDGALRETLAEWKRDREALMARFDTDGDGELDLEEWERARAAAAEEVRERYAEQLAAAGVDVLCADPDGSRPYLLSVVPQDGLARRYKLQALAALIAFFAAGAAATFMLGARLGGVS